jgi:uracil phosphoribosyltransferase
MKEVLLTKLRNKKTDIADFRRNATKLAFLLAHEVGNILEKKTIDIETSIEKTKGVELQNDIILIPILRSALSMVPPFIHMFPYAKVGVIGLRRDEETFQPKMYYKQFPTITKSDNVVILDPMIATGGSGSETIRILKEGGVPEENIIFANIIAAKPGIENIKKVYPKIKIISVHEDQKLNDKKFIVPGLGDFGDRFFGTL